MLVFGSKSVRRFILETGQNWEVEQEMCAAQSLTQFRGLLKGKVI